MKVLVVGGGGREHAVIWKIIQSKSVEKVFCAPGNGGISKIAECVDIKADNIIGMVDFAKKEHIDLVIVTPDDPLVLGMVDALENEGIRAFGPNKNAAIVEGSKAFSKELMKKYDIPTANYEIFDESTKAIEYLKTQKFPMVIKADGLALGKGVIIVENYEDAVITIQEIMNEKKFGEAGNKVVIEEFITGPEVSVLCFTDGKTIVPMVSSQDHKRALDNDKGLNTGGMGTFSPSRIYTSEIAEFCMKKIFKATVNAMNGEGRKFKGVLYFGLMITQDGPKVLEYNARFGDPETQVVLPRLKGDIVEIFNAIIDEKLDTIKTEWYDNAAVCVILSSGGYPQKYETGYEIFGIEEAEKNKDTIVFHSGTKCENNVYFTKGGRVLGVTAIAENLDSAIAKAYESVSKISFKDMHYRKDIGVK